jgi:hypothetical protein
MTWIFLTVTLVCTVFPPLAPAAQIAKLHVAFAPNRLNADTTVVFGFTVAAKGATLPSPVTEATLRLPSTVGFFTSTLGEATCQRSVLSRMGVAGCPPNSRIGFGTALVKVPFGTQFLTETVHTTALAGSTKNEHLEILYYATGDTPVIARLIFQGELGIDALGEYLSTSIPSTPTLPGTTNAAVIRFRTTIGPSHLYYYEYVRGRRVRYRPRGVVLPSRCPRGGFNFSATFDFEDGSTAGATDRVSCPPHQASRDRSRSPRISRGF